MWIIKKLIIIGASGHGKVVADIAVRCGYEITGFLDDNDSLTELAGYPVLGRTSDALKYMPESEFVIAIGSNTVREKIDLNYELRWATLIHPRAVIGMDTEIGEGTVVMANAVINPGSRIGRHCIINTGAIIEHDNIIGNYSHISPNAALTGTVSVGNKVHIGAGAVIRNNISICGN